MNRTPAGLLQMWAWYIAGVQVFRMEFGLSIDTQRPRDSPLGILAKGLNLPHLESVFHKRPDLLQMIKNTYEVLIPWQLILGFPWVMTVNLGFSLSYDSWSWVFPMTVGTLLNLHRELGYLWTLTTSLSMILVKIKHFNQNTSEQKELWKVRPVCPH